jgi:hypothetical protein
VLQGFTAKKLSSVTHAEINPYEKRLKELYEASRGILKKNRFLCVEPATMGHIGVAS